MLRAILNKSRRQHSTKRQLYGHLPPITKTIQVRRTRHAGHCWRSMDELMSDVLLWTPAYGLAKAGRPARTCIQQLCEDTGCSPEDLPEAMNDWEKWREIVWDIRACDMMMIWPIDGILTSTTTPGQSGCGSNRNEGVLHLLDFQNWNVPIWYSLDISILWEKGVLPLCRVYSQRIHIPPTNTFLNKLFFKPFIFCRHSISVFFFLSLNIYLYRSDIFLVLFIRCNHLCKKKWINCPVLFHLFIKQTNAVSDWDKT